MMVSQAQVRQRWVWEAVVDSQHISVEASIPNTILGGDLC